MTDSEHIVAPIIPGESRSSAVAKIRAMIDSRLGVGASADARTFGDLRALLNSGAPAEFQIAAAEAGASVRAKLNGWHRAAPVLQIAAPTISPQFGVVGTVFTITPGRYVGASPILQSGLLRLNGIVVAASQDGQAFDYESTSSGQLEWSEVAENRKGSTAETTITASVSQSPEAIEPTSDGALILSLPDLINVTATPTQDGAIIGAA